MDPSQQLQKLGQQAYKRKNFHAALSWFNSVIAQEREPSLDVLDNRAATYEKLGDLHAALKDGRRMVSDYKSSCTGYLRTGKILQLLGKDTTALGIYQYGLRNVPPSDTDFKILRQMHDGLSRSCIFGKAKDPLAVLPAEIAEMVLSYFDFRQIVSLARVSRTWQAYLTSMPSLWTELDFSAATTGITSSSQDPLLEKLPELRELSLANWRSHTPIPTPGKLEMGHLQKVTLENFRGEISLQSLPSLRSVELRECSYLLKQFSTFGVKPDLRVLGLSKFSISYAELEPKLLLQLIGSKVDDLKELRLRHCCTLEECDLAKMVDMGYFDQLVDLDLCGTRVTDSIIEKLAPRAQQLQRINLATTSVTGISVKTLALKPDAVAWARSTKGLIVRTGVSITKDGKNFRNG
ncbi:MAG: hypothetical protein L6R39_002812 [Caloplaca ligustica]|nr:MAG: hypothetical protein L6R39_002812 [Caloplaca ligustica]